MDAVLIYRDAWVSCQALPISDTLRADSFLLKILFHILLRNCGCTCKASGSLATRITRLCLMLLLSGTAFCFYSGSLDFFHVQVQVRQSSSVLFSYLNFSSLLLLFSFSFPFICDRASFNYSSCCFCGTLWLPLRRTAATGLPAAGSRLCTFFFLAVSLVARKS